MDSPQPTPIQVILSSHAKSSLRWIIPLLLIVFSLLTLIWLPLYTQQQETGERQEQLIADSLWVEQTIQFQLSRDDESMRTVGNEIINGLLTKEQFQTRLDTLFRNNREFYRVIWMDETGLPIAATDNIPLSIADLPAESQETQWRARNTRRPLYSTPTTTPDYDTPMLMDYHIPLYRDNTYLGNLVVSYAVGQILNEMVPWWFARDHEVVLADINDKVFTRRASGGPGLSIFTYRRELELPGITLVLHTNSTKTAPTLFPNLLVGSIIILSLGLLGSLWALWRDIKRRMTTERALEHEISFRKAMENSLITGMRARDLKGRITYVNPAFCKMVGMSEQELLGQIPPMPYWAPEAMHEYEERFTNVLAGRVTPQFETIFKRINGERFPVLIFESPLVDENGQQTGWMGSILDVSEQKRAEDLSRIQEEKLQSSARLAYMGEIASTLAHELNQPLAAISSYATGAQNMVNNNQLEKDTLLPALDIIRTQAQRAGHVIRSVHQFVKKHEPTRKPIQIKKLIDNIAPLIELQAQQFLVVVKHTIAADLPDVLGDPVLLEQVILNLARNGIQAMATVESQRRILHIKAELITQGAKGNMVSVSVIDQGHGISDEVASRLFSPFFSTKADGMGMGLNICRTLIELHGGTLSYRNNTGGGIIFQFTLPVGRPV